MREDLPWHFKAKGWESDPGQEHHHHWSDSTAHPSVQPPQQIKDFEADQIIVWVHFLLFSIAVVKIVSFGDTLEQNVLGQTIKHLSSHQCKLYNSYITSSAFTWIFIFEKYRLCALSFKLCFPQMSVETTAMQEVLILIVLRVQISSTVLRRCSSVFKSIINKYSLQLIIPGSGGAFHASKC